MTPAPAKPFQFGIASIFVLTAVVAVLLVVTRQGYSILLRMPVYLMAIAGTAIAIVAVMLAVVAFFEWRRRREPPATR